MATKRTGPKFHRETPEVRREALVDATLRCLKAYGHEGVSVRRISAAASSNESVSRASTTRRNST